MKLHLGCGTKKLPGWINIDSVAGCGPDVVHDLAHPLPYADQSADDVLAEDLLEHFDKYMRVQVMGDWVRVLKTGGTMTLRVPDFKKLIFRYFKFNFDGFVDTIFGENLWNGRVYIGHYGNHKWGYSQETLKGFVAQFGVETVSMQTKGLNIHFTGRKVRHLSRDEIDQIRIVSHNNKAIEGMHRITHQMAQERIHEFQTNPHH